MRLAFEHTHKLTDRGIVRVPLVEVVFTNPTTNRAIIVDCRIDTGADNIVLNAELAEELGLDPTKGEAGQFRAATQDPITAYTHSLKVRVKRDTHTFTAPCSFLPGLNVTGVLGLEGFFDHYKILFERYKNSFELTWRKPNR